MKDYSQPPPVNPEMAAQMAEQMKAREVSEREREAKQAARQALAIAETVRVAKEIRTELMQNGFSVEAASNASGSLTLAAIMMVERIRY